MVASLLAAAALVAALQWLLSSSAATDAGSQRRRASSSSPASPSSPRERRAASEVSAQRRGADAYSGHEWRNLSRSLPHCLSSQAELMSIPVPWPGFHALCIESFGDGEVSVLLHARSARHGDAGGAPSETSAGERRIYAASLTRLRRGQFLWPGVRIGHKFRVPIPRVAEDGEHSETRMVARIGPSVKPLVLVLSGFLSDGECDFIKSYAASRMVVRYEKGQKYGAHRDFFNPNDYHRHFRALLRQPSMLRSVEYGARNRLATVFWRLRPGAGSRGEAPPLFTASRV
uniref:Alpha-ketoglutarate-dependent dioxygenase AlkB-like domain-containing protein n=2 Tax=Emiliania huxleyi TaxID=2903 RepID=A0A0D3JJD6_EMIH1